MEKKSKCWRVVDKYADESFKVWGLLKSKEKEGFETNFADILKKEVGWQASIGRKFRPREKEVFKSKKDAEKYLLKKMKEKGKIC